MKKFISVWILLIACISLLGQVTTPEKNRDYYLHKSKTQKTVAYTLLGSGSAIIFSGILISSGKESSLSDYGTGIAIAIVGGVTMLSSIPFFILSADNKKKAAVAITVKELYLPPYITGKKYRVPGLTFTLTLD